MTGMGQLIPQKKDYILWKRLTRLLQLLQKSKQDLKGTEAECDVALIPW